MVKRPLFKTESTKEFGSLFFITLYKVEYQEFLQQRKKTVYFNVAQNHVIQLATGIDYGSSKWANAQKETKKKKKSRFGYITQNLLAKQSWFSFSVFGHMSMPEIEDTRKSPSFRDIFYLFKFLFEKLDFSRQIFISLPHCLIKTVEKRHKDSLA